MKIIKASIFHVILPMKFSFTTGFGTIKSRHTVITKLETDNGLVGWGESAALHAPIYNPETIETCIHIQRDYLLPVLLHRNLELEEYVKATDNIRGNRIAKFGIECALWDIKSQIENTPVSVLIGGTKTIIPIGDSIGIQDSIDTTISVISNKLSAGYQRIKLKIRPGWDINLIKAVRQIYPNIQLMVDANSSYTLDDINIFHTLDKYNLMMIEQPLAEDDIIDHAKIQKIINTPICLDESIESFDDARKAIELGSCKIINVKPGRVGGLLETIKINNLAKQEGIPLWCGGMIEAGIAKSYNLAAASLSEFSLPADCSPTQEFFHEDITHPKIILNPNGTITLSTLPGLGYMVDEAILKKYTTLQLFIL